MNTELIEVVQKDVKRAKKILFENNVDFAMENRNTFIIADQDDWNIGMEAWEDEGIEIL